MDPHGSQPQVCVPDVVPEAGGADLGARVLPDHVSHLHSLAAAHDP